MKTYKSRTETEKDVVNGTLIIDDNVTFEFNLECDWNIEAWNITAQNITAHNIKADNITAYNINAWNIKAKNIEAWNITAWNIYAYNINAWNIRAWNITARDINAKNINADNIKADSIKALHIKADNINAQNIKARDIGWQSIETAPKDGTIISLWSAEAGLIISHWWDKCWTCGLDDVTHWRREVAPNGEYEYLLVAEKVEEVIL